MAKPGLSTSSPDTTKIVKSGNVYKKYTVSEEVVDLTPLKAELAMLEAQTQPTDEELLISVKKGELHPYYDRNRQMRIDFLRLQISQWEG